jgi:hypothetical protein
MINAAIEPRIGNPILIACLLIVYGMFANTKGFWPRDKRRDQFIHDQLGLATHDAPAPNLP